MCSLLAHSLHYLKPSQFTPIRCAQCVLSQALYLNRQWSCLMSLSDPNPVDAKRPKRVAIVISCRISSVEDHPISSVQYQLIS